MSQVLVVSEEIVRSMAQTIACLQCDLETYRNALAALRYSANLVRQKRLLYSQISSVTSYQFACDILRDGMEAADKIIEARACDVVDDDIDYCTDCELPITRESAQAGRCLTCNP